MLVYKKRQSAWLTQQVGKNGWRTWMGDVLVRDSSSDGLRGVWKGSAGSEKGQDKAWRVIGWCRWRGIFDRQMVGQRPEKKKIEELQIAKLEGT